MQCRWPLYDAAGQPAALLTLDVDRKWYIESQNQRDFLLTMIVAAGVMNFILIMVFMDRAILTRINSMMDDIDKIGKGEMKERRVRALGNDELKDLGVQMNIMLEGWTGPNSSSS
jgi:signal transduction histidine kinase